MCAIMRELVARHHLWLRVIAEEELYEQAYAWAFTATVRAATGRPMPTPPRPWAGPRAP